MLGGWLIIALLTLCGHVFCFVVLEMLKIVKDIQGHCEIIPGITNRFTNMCI